MSIALQILRIWGDDIQVRAAKKELQAWLERNRPPRQDWAKIESHTEKKKKLLDKQMEKEALSQSYRRNPAADEIFTHRVR